MEPEIIAILKQATNEAEQVGREIYYAMTYLDDNHPAKANLKSALKCLGVNKPIDVGLSNSVLKRKVYGA